mgnify:FL=1
MAFQLSPGVNVSEIDLTTVVPAVATTEGAMVGVFRWGPTNEAILVSSEVELVQRFGEPYANTSWSNIETFFTCANFLSYADALYVTRVTSNTASAASSTSFDAAYEGELGNSILVSWGAGTAALDGSTASANVAISASSSTGTLTANTDTIEVGDAITLTGDDGGNQVLIVTEVDGLGLTFDRKFIGTANYSGAFDISWGYGLQFDANPINANSVHVVVIDSDGSITGEAGTILERYDNLSTQEGARKFDGSTNYIVEVLEQQSDWIRVKDGATFSAGANYETLSGGLDGAGEQTISAADLALGYDLYQTSENVDVSLIMTGRPNTVVANYVIDNVVEKRKDAIAFISPVVTPASYTAQDVVNAVSPLSSSSYAVVDSGYKYQYDKYSDRYRYVPLNGDIAGLCARTDDVRDAWFSPAGYNRGGIKNVVKLSLNPTRAERDLLYKNGINPVINQPGQGTLLFGDKTYLNQPSAFDRINVRRLFIVLEKAIAVAAKSTLFEFNDEFTRAQFKNLVEPFLRDVQGRRGIFDFRVVCDETNNTAEVIDRNEFVGDIYVKPAKSINFIQLNFVAVRTGVEFSEIVGSA